jgi:hypothetical protein
VADGTLPTPLQTKARWSSPAGLIIQKPIEGSQYIRGNPESTALT